MYRPLNELLIDFKKILVEAVHELFLIIATKFFNYPEVPGMLAAKNLSNFDQRAYDYFRNLPVHETVTPPWPRPRTLIQALFGNTPHFEPIKRHFYTGTHNQFGFYVPNFQNIFFIPDAVSKFIQLKFEIITNSDVNQLVQYQQALFVVLMVWYFIIETRLKMYWFLSINPYKRPFNYFIGMVDPFLDSMNAIFPLRFNLDYSPTVASMLLGKIIDTLNHLVFTMPFLPSEGMAGTMKQGEKIPPVKCVYFRFVPRLWQDYPIPDRIREFWYRNSPKILKYLEKWRTPNGDKLDYLPERILQAQYDSVHENVHNIHHFSTNLLSDISLHTHLHNHNVENFISNSIHLYSDILHKIH